MRRIFALIAALLLSCGGAASSTPPPAPVADPVPVDEGTVIVLPDDTELRAADCADKYDRERALCVEVFEEIDQCDADFTGADRALCIGATKEEYITGLGFVDRIDLPDGTTVRRDECDEQTDQLLRLACREMFQTISACLREAEGARDTPCERDAIADFDAELNADD